MRLIAGLEQPTSGRIRIGSRDVTALPPRDRDLAMVFQDLGLYGHLSAYENLAFGLRLRQKGKWTGVAGERLTVAQIDGRVLEAASMLGITSLLDRKPGELSGGQQQRVALGRAIVRRPQAMLMDEPLASLDAPRRRDLRRELKRLHGELKMTAIYVTHDQAEAMALGDRIAVMNAGRIEQIAEPEEIYRRPATRFVAGFFGSQGMNFATGELDDATGATGIVPPGILPIAAADWPDALTDGEVTVGFRPEDGVLHSEAEPGQLAWEVKVLAVESLGDLAYATVCPAPECRPTWVVQVDGRGAGPAAGQNLLLAVRPGGWHWFGEDGRRFA